MCRIRDRPFCRGKNETILCKKEKSRIYQFFPYLMQFYLNYFSFSNEKKIFWVIDKKYNFKQLKNGS